MINIKDLRERPEAYKKACKDKNIKFDIDAFLALDEEYRSKKTAFEELRSQQNKASKEIGKLKPEERQAKMAEVKDLSEKLKSLSDEFKALETDWTKQQYLIPAIALDKTPIGKDDSENVEEYKWGEPINFDFEYEDHYTLGKKLGIIDIERGVKIAGARSYFLVGDGARLQDAVMQLAKDLLHKKGYQVMHCPHIVKYEAMQGTSYFPGGEEMAYSLDDRDEGFYLIGTSEVSVASFHADEILDLESLPKRYAGYSPCYRREAGTYGKDTSGLYRVHQFYKVEQVIICKDCPEESAKMHAELLGNAEELMQLLELPYRVVKVCTGDMGQGQVFKNDIEAWMPSRKAYGETHSCSTFHDFQARRLKIRYKDKEGDNQFCHTLNNTLIASPRVLIPLIENNQTKDGEIIIPKALRPYMLGQEVIA